MSNMPSEEIVVYGDAPDEPSTTDTISIPVDFLTFYEPLGPVIVNPPTAPTGGGGGDVVNPKDEFGEAETKSVWIAAGFTVLAMIPGVGEVVMTVAAVSAVAFGLGAYHLGNAADDPPQPHYQRDAGSTLPRRSLRLSGPPPFDRSIQKLVAVEHATAHFVDAIECAQGAFLAADVPWIERHLIAARQAYVKLGQALLTLADALPELTKPLNRYAGLKPARTATQLQALLGDVRPMLDLSPLDMAHVAGLLRPALGRGIPSAAELAAAEAAIGRLGRRLATPTLANVRFAFPKPVA